MAREELHPGWPLMEPEEADGPLYSGAFLDEDGPAPCSAAGDVAEEPHTFDFAIASF
ncbi:MULTISPECIES: hypothetical protein [Corallococcus]|uniref:hypothetical protein n=1 Tax=Corallococcus TaxID=83461 RepID=UPI001378EFDA|nr:MULTISPECIES: hypothetical protein [Corallococcus]NBD08711.1 hypothetical protein [Corallococcus silvisoli]